MSSRVSVTRPWRRSLLPLALALLLVTSGCSLRKLAVNTLADALAGSTSSTFATDDDPGGYGPNWSNVDDYDIPTVLRKQMD